MKTVTAIPHKDNPSDLLVDSNGMKQLKKNLNDIIFEDLKVKILRGDIPTVTKLQEDKLAKEYNISRTPVRDALRRLEQDDILIKLDYGGYQIKELTIKEIEEIFRLRAVIESYAAYLATSRISESEINKLEEILKKLHNAVQENNLESFIDLNTHFHSVIYFASRSEHLIKILRGLWDYFYRYRKTIFSTERNLKDSLADHDKMFQEMITGTPETVEALVKEHVLNALSAFKKEANKVGNMTKPKKTTNNDYDVKQLRP